MSELPELQKGASCESLPGAGGGTYFPLGAPESGRGIVVEGSDRLYPCLKQLTEANCIGISVAGYQ